MAFGTNLFSTFQEVRAYSPCPSTDPQGGSIVKTLQQVRLVASAALYQHPKRRGADILPPVATVINQSESKFQDQEQNKQKTMKKGMNPVVTSLTSKSQCKGNPPAQKEKAAREQVQAVESLLPVNNVQDRHLFQYSEEVPKVSFAIFPDERGTSIALAHYVAQVSKDSVKAKDSFCIVLSGGSLVKALEPLIQESSIEWSKWHIFWVDERVVPLTHQDSNYKHAMDAFLSNVPVPEDQIHPIHYTSNANIVAAKYAHTLRDAIREGILILDHSKKFPSFDLVLLGMGPDGHIASLFPNSVALAEEEEWVVSVSKSPKPPPHRITVTLPLINAASHVAFVIFGSNKAEILQRVLERPALPGALPAQMVRPSDGELRWFVDEQAASLLSVDTWEDPKRFPAVNFSVQKKTNSV